MRFRSVVCATVYGFALFAVGTGAQAQLTTFSSEATFNSATGNLPFESFEGLSARIRSSNNLTLPQFTVTPDDATLGVTDGLNSPETTYGTVATDGTKALFIWKPNQPTGTLRFDLKEPATAFGFNIIDAGEAAGAILIRTDAGETLSDVALATFPPTFNDGNVQFLGFTQGTPFTQVFLTVTIRDEAYGLDKLYVNVVPEPGAIATGLIATGSVVALIARRRIRR